MPKVSHILEQAVAKFGSQAKLAAAVGVAQPTVCKAIKTNRAGKQLALGLHAATRGKINKSDLRPDLWPPKSKK